MRSQRDGDFEKNIQQLMQLLKKIIVTQPNQKQIAKMQSFFKEQGLNFNLFFFNFFPMSDEELDELEEIYEQYFFDDDKTPEDLTTDLNLEDIEFLRKNGIRF